ncbi:DUF6268 family outer membrane beta-barrel protein [Fulvivirga ulvae]|uniref:DUF6268 family outer membrane beta-barrel protein n=1 Tax=Fulvivirga ulvae TaxID=2904245 RepID=UPI001F22A4DA|nr:DUF6268 family outer membrane beta-barrel protein [Fulvivirga ulvae]UII31451.1 DUF6268 family outer membrane beta-barrel protein [Fulvivirga ulvae]
MRSNKTLWSTVCVLLLLSGSQVMSQEIKLAGFSFTRFPGAAVKGSPLNREIEVNEYNFFVNFPKRLEDEKTVLINGLQYKLITPFADNDVTIGIDGQNLHLVCYRLTVLRALSNNWSLFVSLSPTLSSTFNTRLEKEDFLFNGILHFVKKKSDHFSYGGGIALTARFGNSIPIPTVQLTYKSEKGKLQVFLPRHITYDRYFGKLTAGLKVEVDGSLYNVNYTRISPPDELQPVNKVGYTRVIFGPHINYRVGKFIQLEASGGMTAGQSVELQSELFSDDKYDVDNGAFLRFGISILPP